jgi:hypothetical protein
MLPAPVQVILMSFYFSCGYKISFSCWKLLVPLYSDEVDEMEEKILKETFLEYLYTLMRKMRWKRKF